MRNLSLKVGQAEFWNGGFIASGAVASASSCQPTTCPSWPITVAPGGSRLRVAIDTPSRDDTFGLNVIDPAGTTAASTANSNQFNAEAFVDHPSPGRWTVQVVPQQVSDAAFRLRAKLEGATTAKPATKTALLPNLKAVPPMEFGFVAPANPLNGLYPPDTVNPPLAVGAVHPLSCAPDEMAPVALGGSGAHTCLRLTSGPINVGRGAFDMRFDLAGDMAAGKAKLNPGNLTNTVTGLMQQAVHYSDGSESLRPAGTYSFHTTHGHFHTDQILTYELFKVLDPTAGTMAPRSAGTKSGFCPADQLFGDWRTFNQQKQGDFGEGDSASGNCMSPSKGALGLTSGWGDVYRWQRPGQFVEFDGGDGLYVVRSTVDKSNHILEENENDNSAYAYIKVVGHDVTSLERGQGLSPWDPAKVVFKGAGPASVEAIGGEAVLSAPADTPPAPAPAAPSPPAGPALPVTGGGSTGWWGGALLLAGVAVRRRVVNGRIGGTAG